MGKIILNGKEYTGGGQSESPAEFFHFEGIVWDSQNGTIQGAGSISITLTGGIARIDFDVKITNSGTGSSEFNHGINTNLLAAIEPNLPAITPIPGGYWINSSSSPSTDYGSVFDARSGYWIPARYYNTSDFTQTGEWAENNFSSGRRIYGVCYGTYE